MPIIAGRTRVQLRQSIGYNLHAIYVSAATAAGTTTTIVDSSLLGGTDHYKGHWVKCTSGANIAQVTRVASFTGTTLTVSPAFTVAYENAASYELWREPYYPAMIDEYINQAILDATGLAFDDEEDVTLCGDGRQASFAIPPEFAMLNQVAYRSYVESILVQHVTTAWSELVQSGLSAVVDTKDYKSGTSLKVTVTAAAAASARITQSFAALDISGYDFIEFWFKSTFATLAGGIHLLLDDTAQAASPVETLALPALVANTWKFVRIALANPESDTALVSIGVRFTTDNGAQTAWLGPVRAVRDDSAIWTPLAWGAWTVDSEARTLKLKGNTAAAIGGRLLKLVGGDKPALLAADATANEIDDWYVICRATELAYNVDAVGNDTARQIRAGEAARWAHRADSARGGFPYLQNARLVG